jgi:hypothetical protein
MRKLCLVLVVAACCGLFAATAQAKLSPTEEKWAKPLITIWNVQNAGLHLVIPQASAKYAMIAGYKPDSANLSKTLYALVSCKVPKDLIAKAGTPPSPRMVGFRDSLNAACLHNGNGANDFAKAIGAVTKGDMKLEASLIKQGVAEFKLGTVQLTNAYKALIALGGKNIFVA